ncbi:T-cell surface tactile-like [Solea senegalensis]|uniref:T-cell surface tactile-like n=1 Tax=Solea senegalensis TaxID=28829 RepID=A0AAV6SHD0_SOLSE|nr:T-cell surface tactile-like [Solea senegalensis]
MTSLTGLRDDVGKTRYETTEAVVGQNVTLQCDIKTRPGLNIVSFEWRKKKNETHEEKLALFNLIYGVNKFRPNVSLEFQNNSANMLMRSYLHLSEVKKWDSGVYICDIATFPAGSTRREIELKIKDVVEITCDANTSVSVHYGENVTIHCGAAGNSRYRWTNKNKELVSENGSLELLSVSDAEAGIYTLTVSTGNESMHKQFTITVQPASTSVRTDSTTVSPHGHVTEAVWPEPRVNSSTTSLTSRLTTNVTQTRVNDVNPNNDSVTAITETNFSDTSAAATHTGPNLFLSSTALSPGAGAGFTSRNREMESDEMRNESESHTRRPEESLSARPQETSTSANITDGYKDSGVTPTSNTSHKNGASQRHLLVLIIVPVLLLIVMAGVLYRRHLMQQRMDLPLRSNPPLLRLNTQLQDTGRFLHSLSPFHGATRRMHLRI